MKFTFEVPDDVNMDPRKVRAMLSRGYIAFQKERLDDVAFKELRPLGGESTESVEAQIAEIVGEGASRAEREEKAWRGILSTFEMVP